MLRVTPSLLLAVAAAVSACGGAGGGDPAAPAAPVAPAVAITSPEFAFHGTGPVVIQVVVDGCDPATVELLVDGETLATLVPPFQYTWDTTWANEGHRLVAARASCGGAAATSAPIDVHVDRTPPTVIARLPAPGSHHASVADPIEVTFSEPMDLASARPAIVLRNGGTSVPFAITASRGGATLTLVPATAPAAGTTLTVEIGAGIRDLARLPLDAATSWAFTYPLLVQPPGGPIASGIYAGTPRLAIDARGEPRVAWRSGQGLSYVTFAPDGTPQATTVPVPYGRDCDVGVQGAEVYLVDSSYLYDPSASNPVTYEIRFLKPDGATFVAAGPVVADGTRPGFDPQLTFDADGTPVVVWSDLGAGFTGPQLVHAAFLDAGAWSDRGTSALNLDPSLTTYAPAVARDSQGRPAVAFTENARVYVKRWNGSGWSLLGSGAVAGSGSSYVPSIAFDGDDPYVAVRDGSGGLRVYHLSGGVWVAIPGDPRRSALPADMPAIAVSGPGRFHVAWTEGSYGAEPYAAGNLYVAEWNGSVWNGLPGPLNRGSDSPAYAPALAVDGFRAPVVAWAEVQDPSSTPVRWDLRVARANR
jgi:hypothetical protein